MFGTKKSPTTIAKLQKLVYVYEAETLKFIGVFPTVECIKHFKMGKDTLTKYLDSKLPFSQQGQRKNIFTSTIRLIFHASMVEIKDTISKLGELQEHPRTVCA